MPLRLPRWRPGWRPWPTQTAAAAPLRLLAPQGLLLLRPLQRLLAPQGLLLLPPLQQLLAPQGLLLLRPLQRLLATQGLLLLRLLLAPQGLLLLRPPQRLLGAVIRSRHGRSSGCRRSRGSSRLGRPSGWPLLARQGQRLLQARPLQRLQEVVSPCLLDTAAQPMRPKLVYVS